MKLRNSINLRISSRDLNIFTKKNSVLLNLKLLKAKTYEKNLKHRVSLFDNEKNLIQLKTILLVIYSYHFLKKTILFTGIYNDKVADLNKLQHSHIFLRFKSSFKNIILDQKRSNNDNIITKLKFPSLAVDFGSQDKTNNVSKFKIPSISFNTATTNKSYKSLYKISVKKEMDFHSIFLSLLNPLLFRSRASRYNQIMITKNSSTNFKIPVQKTLKKNLGENKANKLLNKLVNQKLIYDRSDFSVNKYQHIKSLSKS